MQIKPGQKLSRQMRIMLKDLTSRPDWVEVGNEVGISHESIRLILKDINPLRVTEKTSKAFIPLFKRAMENKAKREQEQMDKINDCKFEISLHRKEIKRLQKSGYVIRSISHQIMSRI